MIVEQIHRSECEFIRKKFAEASIEDPDSFKVILVAGLGKFKPNTKRIKFINQLKYGSRETNAQESISISTLTKSGEEGNDTTH